MALSTFRRTATLAFGAAVLGLGTGTAAWAAREPTATEIERYCALEEEGAHQLAQDLRRRERELDGREHGLDAQRAEMATAEARLAERLAELETSRKALEALLVQADGEREKRIAGLVKMIEASRASNVAPMFAELDEDLAVTVLDRMNRTKAGRLLAVLPPTKAASLAEKMAEPISVELP